MSRFRQIWESGIKFEDYALHGVREYWIIDPEREFVEQYFLNKVYELHVKAMTGVLESSVVTGFVIPVQAIFDEAEQFTALRALLAHAQN